MFLAQTLRRKIWDNYCANKTQKSVFFESNQCKVQIYQVLNITCFDF